MPPTPYLLTFVGTLAICFAIQTATLRAFHGRTHKSESNFFSSMARLQTGVTPLPSVMLLGSSMTGRLPDRSNGFYGVANLGCDGGSALPILRAIARGDFPTPATLVIEANTLERGLVESGEIDDAIRSAWFWVGVKMPQLSAAARPSAFVYSALFSRRHGPPPSHGGSYEDDVYSEPRPWADLVPLEPKAQKAVREIRDLIERLIKRRAQILIVQLPCRREMGATSLAIAREVSRCTGVGYLDLGSRLSKAEVKYTDDVHLDGPSASLCLRCILQSCGQSSPGDGTR